MSRFKSMMRSIGQRLVDQYGQPVKKSDLEGERLEPSFGSVRPVISGHPAEGLNPQRLARIHREAAQGEPLSYLELAEDIEERDLHYAGVMATRKRSVAQLPITVETVSDDAQHKKHADFIRSWIADDILQASLFDMLDAIGKGFSIMEIDWRYHMGHTCPREFQYRPQRWFMFDTEDGETLVLRDQRENELLTPHKFVIHRHRSKSGLTIRSGLARVASWAWMYKQFTLKDWAIFTQNYGMPIRIGKYGGNATEAEKDVLWRAVRNIAGDCAAIVPIDMKLEFHEIGSKGSTSDLYERRADWMDKQISKAVLGQTTTTDAVSGGHAVAKEHRLVQEDIERSDAISLSATLNRQLIPNMIAFNFGPQDHYPKVRIGRPDEVPLAEFAEAFGQLGPIGLTAPMTYMRNRLGIPEPKQDEDVVGGRAATPLDRLFDQAEQPSRNSFAQLLSSRHGREHGDVLVDRLTRRLEEDAAGAIAGVTDEVRKILMGAASLTEAAEQLAALDLDTAQLSDAIARGMALSHLVGQAALIDDIERRR